MLILYSNTPIHSLIIPSGSLVNNKPRAVAYTTMMNNIAFGNYPRDHGQLWLLGTFISANATKKSLDEVQENVKELWNVPAFRQTLTCEPAKISEFTAYALTPKVFSINLAADFSSSHSNATRIFIHHVSLLKSQKMLTYAQSSPAASRENLLKLIVSRIPSISSPSSPSIAQPQKPFLAHCKSGYQQRQTTPGCPPTNPSHRILETCQSRPSSPTTA